MKNLILVLLLVVLYGCTMPYTDKISSPRIQARIEKVKLKERLNEIKYGECAKHRSTFMESDGTYREIVGCRRGKGDESSPNRPEARAAAQAFLREREREREREPP